MQFDLQNEMEGPLFKHDQDLADGDSRVLSRVLASSDVGAGVPAAWLGLSSPTWSIPQRFTESCL